MMRPDCLTFGSMRKLFCLAALTTTFAATAQYHPAEIFQPQFYAERGNPQHGANGAPGPAYWQNRADYHLHATLDTATKTINATETIDYTNNSPDALDCLWLRRWSKTHTRMTRARMTIPISIRANTRQVTILSR